MVTSLKCKKSVKLEVVDFYKIGREIPNLSGSSIGVALTEDRQFRQYVGVGAAVALITWNLVSQHGLLSDDSMILYMLWALHFIKAYLKQDARSAAA